MPKINRTLAPGHRSTPHLAPHEVSRSRMRGADANEGLPAATLDGACAPPSFSAQTHAQRHAPHARAALNPHPPRSRARNVRPSRCGPRAARARGAHAPLRPGRASRRRPRTRRAHREPRARRLIRRRSRPSYGSYGRNGTRWPRRRRRREESLLGDSAKVKYHLSCILRSGEHRASVL